MVAEQDRRYSDAELAEALEAVQVARLTFPDGVTRAERHAAAARRAARRPTGPEFILRLSGEDAEAELAALARWVNGVLIPVYVTEPTGRAPWCPRWQEHGQAVARLHALWLAWQELTTPATGGRLGPSTWHRVHLDPALAELRRPDGPFAGCTVSADNPQHRAEQPAPLPAPGPATNEPAGSAPPQPRPAGNSPGGASAPPGFTS